MKRATQIVLALAALHTPEASAGVGIGWTSGDVRGADGDVILSLVRAWAEHGELSEVIDLLWAWIAT